MEFRFFKAAKNTDAEQAAAKSDQLPTLKMDL